jgi:transposase
VSFTSLTRDDRRRRLVELYEQGLSCSEIGRRLDLSRQWVGQLLASYEIPAVPARERRYLAAVKGRETEIVEAFLQLRNDAAVAERLDLHESHVRRVVDATVPDAALLRRPRRTRRQRYSDQELVAALREAAPNLASPMGHDAYRDWARRRSRDGHPWPGTQVAMKRFGGWRKALASAGLPTNRGGGPRTTYDLEDAVAALGAAWRELGHYPSVVDYDAWRAGRGGIPASATARRFAASWDDLLLMAYPLVHGLREGVQDVDPAGCGDRSASPRSSADPASRRDPRQATCLPTTSSSARWKSSRPT